MQMIRESLKLIFLLCLATPPVCGQKLEIVSSRPQTMPGIVLGAVFNENKNEFFIQDFTFRNTAGGQIGQRRISSWNLSSGEMKGNPRIDEYPATSSSYPCGRIEFVPSMNAVVVCSQGSSLEFLDGGSLVLKEKMELINRGTIFDFAIDKGANTLLVLSLSTDKKVHIASYSLSDRTQRSDLVLEPGYATSTLSVAISPSSRLAAVTTTLSEKGKGTLYSCTYDRRVECKSLGDGPPISQIDFLGKQLLFAPSSFPDDKRACITSVNLSTNLRTKAYCAPRTGVHFAVGVIEEKYIVGYTGLRSTNWLTENAKVVENSFSVWRPENKQSQAKVNDPTNDKGLQLFLIVTSKSMPYFIAFDFSNEFCLYKIKEVE